jgi:quinol monooxygenase YgiN
MLTQVFPVKNCSGLRKIRRAKSVACHPGTMKKKLTLRRSSNRKSRQESMRRLICSPNGAKEEFVELFIFARFRARTGQENALEEALQDVLAPTRKEAGCIRIHAFRSTRDPRLFYIHSQWTNEAAFEIHAGLPHTVKFIERVEPLIDHPLDVTRAELIG